MLGPIFAREFVTVPRRESHYTTRAAALGLLWTLGITAWLATADLTGTATLGDTARFGRLVFGVFTFVQLTLGIFFAALSAASAVAQEKDRRTFVLLLMTDLRDAEIVLGKLVGSLIPIGLYLLGTLPVLALLVLLGGISPEQVVQSWLVLIGAAFAAGSLGGFVALGRDRTFPALALSVLGLVLYFCFAQLVGALPWDRVGVEAASAVAALNPYVALQAVLNPSVDDRVPPVVPFLLVMGGLSVALNLAGIRMLRVWNPGGEPIMQRESPDDAPEEEKDRMAAHAAPGAVRAVWANPILWREVRTRAYGRRPLLVKLAYALVLGLILYGAFGGDAARGGRVPFQAAYGLLPVAILSLLLVAAQAVTAITTERDVGALDLLLVTDLTPREFILGKLAGIAYNAKEFLLPPLILACVYAGLDLLAAAPKNAQEQLGVLNAQSLAAVLGGLLVLLAFVVVLGVHVGLRNLASRQAITNTLGTTFFLSVGTLVCIYLILINGGTFEYQLASFSLFLIAGIGGLAWVLNANVPSSALWLASGLLPVAMFYCVVNVIVAKPGTEESAPPLVPFLVIAGAFGFAIAAMMVPLLSEFDVALGRTRAED